MVVFGASIQAILAEEFARRPADPRRRVLEAVEELATDFGLDAVELYLDGLFLFPDVVDDGLLADIGRLQQRIGLTLTAHLPYVWVDISAANELTRRASVEAVVRAIQACSPLDVTSFVLHATGPFGNEVAPGVADPEQSLFTRLMLAAIDRSFADLARTVPGTPLAVETMDGFPFAWQAPLVERYDLGVCCDVSHLLVRDEDPIAFLDAWLPRIRQLHLHGVREQALGVNLRRRIDHRALGGPGELVDVPRLLDHLTVRGFTGPVILENLSRADLVHSVATINQALEA